MLFQFLLTKFSKSEPVFKSKLITWPTIAKGLLRGKQQRLPRVFPLPFSMVNSLRMELAPKVLSFAKASWCHQEAATKQVKSTYESSGPSGRSLFLFLWHEMTRNILFFSLVLSLFFLRKIGFARREKAKPARDKKLRLPPTSPSVQTLQLTAHARVFHSRTP